MSSDAKVWFREGRWYGHHDGWCGWEPVVVESPGITYTHEDHALSQLLVDMETCLGGRDLRWEPHIWADGVQGLRGWRT